MKKKLEADLISIAHRVLKIKKKSDIVELHKEAQLLYEKLSVLLFIDEHFGNIKTNYTHAIQNRLEESLNKIGTLSKLHVKDPSDSIESKMISQEKTKPTKNSTPILETHTNLVVQDDKKEQVSTLKSSDTTNLVPEEHHEDFSAIIEKFTTHTYEKSVTLNAIDPENTKKSLPLKEESLPPKESLEDVLRNIQPDPVFIKAQQQELVSKDDTENIKIHESKTFIETEQQNNVMPVLQKGDETPPAIPIKTEPVQHSKKHNKGIAFGLNNRIAFEKYLFNNNAEELNRTILILNAFNNYADAKKYIDHLVKPSYNNWDGKDEYVDRFMEVIKNKFA